MEEMSKAPSKFEAAATVLHCKKKKKKTTKTKKIGRCGPQAVKWGKYLWAWWRRGEA
jgi:hypothetical protein